MGSPTQKHGAHTIRLGEFDFAPESGELLRWSQAQADVEDELGDDVEAKAQLRRLGPQPAHLLRLLIEKNGELLHRDEIRQELWPDVAVDFDQALHFAVRQVRSALDDSAAQPRYIETLPRRGYRLLMPVKQMPMEPPGQPPAIAGDPPQVASRRRWAWVAAGLALVSVLLIAQALAPEARRPLRLGVMPFETLQEPNGIAERILLELAEATTDPAFRLEIVGPTTTERFLGRSRPAQEAAEELDLDFLLNGRLLRPKESKDSTAPEEPAPEAGLQLFAEVIRVSDGAHIWFQSFPDLSDEGAVARSVAAAAREHLAQEKPKPDNR